MPGAKLSGLSVQAIVPVYSAVSAISVTGAAPLIGQMASSIARSVTVSSPVSLSNVCSKTRSSTAFSGMVKEKVFVTGVVVRSCPAVTVAVCAVPFRLALVLVRLTVCVPAAAAVPVSVTVAVTDVLASCGLVLSKVTVAVTPFCVIACGVLNS